MPSPLMWSVVGIMLTNIAREGVLTSTEVPRSPRVRRFIPKRPRGGEGSRPRPLTPFIVRYLILRERANALRSHSTLESMDFSRFLKSSSSRRVCTVWSDDLP